MKTKFCALCGVSPTKRNRLAYTFCYPIKGAGYEPAMICGTCRQTYAVTGKQGITCDVEIIRRNRNPEQKQENQTQPEATYAEGVTVSRDGRVFVEGIECSYFKNTKQYPCVRVKINGKRKTIPVHRMVVDCFLPARPTPKHETRHLDGDKSNNKDTNLKWGTAKENAADREAHGNTARGERNGFSKLTKEKVIKIRQLVAAKTPFVKIAPLFGVSDDTIRLVAHNRIWKHVAAIRGGGK